MTRLTAILLALFVFALPARALPSTHLAGQATQAGHVDTIALEQNHQSVTIDVSHVEHSAILASSAFGPWRVDESTATHWELRAADGSVLYASPVTNPSFTIQMGSPGGMQLMQDIPSTGSITLSPVPRLVRLVTFAETTTVSAGSPTVQVVNTFDADVSVTYAP